MGHSPGLQLLYNSILFQHYLVFYIIVLITNHTEMINVKLYRVKQRNRSNQSNAKRKQTKLCHEQE